MTDKTMPERIHVKPYKQHGCYRLCSDEQTESGDVEYVRADLVISGTDEPLADGQFRLVKVGEDDLFTPASIGRDWFATDKLVYFLCGCEVEGYADELYAIGPVINCP